MHSITTTKALETSLNDLRKKNQTIGFVPTMGALHKGHLSLVQQALAQNNVVVVSIFVNPTQFNDKTDLEHYPRNLETDKESLATLSKNLIVFAPTAQDIYGGALFTNTYDLSPLDSVMEGAFRKNHFNGVATIVELLLNAVKPHKAYFGEKDYQQLCIIKRLVALRNYPYHIIGCPIAREPHGLAMSSRNSRLPKDTRKAANFIYHTLKTAKTKFGIEHAKNIKEWVQLQFKNHTLFRLEYFEIANANTLQPTHVIENNTNYRAFIAVYANEVRLIDNIALN